MPRRRCLAIRKLQSSGNALERDLWFGNLKHVCFAAAVQFFSFSMLVSCLLVPIRTMPIRPHPKGPITSCKLSFFFSGELMVTHRDFIARERFDRGLYFSQ